MRGSEGEILWIVFLQKMMQGWDATLTPTRITCLAPNVTSPLLTTTLTSPLTPTLLHPHPCSIPYLTPTSHPHTHTTPLSPSHPPPTSLNTMKVTLRMALTRSSGNLSLTSLPSSACQVTSSQSRQFLMATEIMLVGISSAYSIQREYKDIQERIQSRLS